MEIKTEKGKNSSLADFLVKNCKKVFLKPKKIKWLILIITSFFVLLAIVASSVYFGLNLYRNPRAIHLKRSVESLYEEHIKIIPNFLSGVFLARPEKIFIDIGFKNFQKIATIRDQAIERGFLISSSEDFVPAHIRYKDKIVKVKIRLKGDCTDHWIDKAKWSFRIELDGDETIFGMSKFSIQLPGNRAFLSEWLLHKMFASLDLAHLRFDFIDVTLNGTHLGVYALEEHFSKQVIENSRFREGPIIRFDETLFWYRELPVDDEDEIYSASLIDAFGTGKIKKNEEASKQFEQAKNLLESFRRGILPVHKVFDVEKLAQLFAVIDLTGNHHTTGFSNMRFYYNPVTSLLEPIGFDNEEMIPLQFLESEVGDKELQLFYPIQIKYLDFKDSFFQDEEFFRAYVASLEKVSQKEFLDDLFIELDQEIKDKLYIIHRSFPEYNFKGKEIFYQNQEYIKVILNPVEALQAFYKNFSLRDGLLNLQLGNAQSLPVEIIGVKFKKETFLPVKKVVLQPKKLHLPIDFQKTAFQVDTRLNFSKSLLDEMTIQYRILGLQDIRTESIVPWSYFDENFLETDLIRQAPNWRSFSFLETDNFSKTIYIKPGFWNVSRNLIFPAGFTILADKGTTLNLSNQAIILSYSPLRFQGTEDRPIAIESLNKTGQGVVVLNAKEKSFLQHVFFHNLRAPSQGNWSMTGAVNFYQSPVDILHCQFEDGQGGDDYLNIIRSQFNVSDSVFKNSLADAVDLDFSQGKFSRSSFIDCGLKDNNGDCLDFSGSVVELEDISIDQAGDKGISIGEKSQVTGSRIEIRSASMGIVSKDNSEAILSDVAIFDSKVGLAVYLKKTEYGPARISVEKLKLENVSQPFLVEEGSFVSVDNKIIEPNDNDVARKLYGE